MRAIMMGMVAMTRDAQPEGTSVSDQVNRTLLQVMNSTPTKASRHAEARDTLRLLPRSRQMAEMMTAESSDLHPATSGGDRWRPAM
jgi:hypothetical protein